MLELPRPGDTAEVQRLYEGEVLWPAVPGGGLGQARGLLRGQDEEEEAGRGGLTSDYQLQASDFCCDINYLVVEDFGEPTLLLLPFLNY